MIAIPYVSITHRIARRLQLYSEMECGSPKDYYFDANFRLQPKHLKGMETDNSIMECFPDSSKLDNVIGDDSFLLSALKNDVKERCIETARSWKPIVTYIFGTGDELSQNKYTPFHQQDDEGHQDGVVDAGPQQIRNTTLQQDHAVLQVKFEKVMDGEDVKAMFPVSHNEKYLELEDKEDDKEDWKSELDHLEGLLANRAQSVTRVDWKHHILLRHMPSDINLLLGEEDINHLNNIPQDDQNDHIFPPVRPSLCLFTSGTTRE